MTGHAHVCSKCSTERTTNSESRIPRGWKRHAGTIWCKTCWSAAFVLRAVTIPVASVIDGASEQGNGWQELWEELTACWKGATQMANWAQTRLRLSEPEFPQNLGDLKTWKPPYLYPEARRLVPTMGSQSVVALLQTVTSKYMKARGRVVLANTESLATYRYPIPYPIHNHGWVATFGTFAGEDNEQRQCPLVKVRLRSSDAENGRRWTLRLRGGAEFRRQLRAFKQIVDGEAVQGEMSIYRATSSSNTRREAVTAVDQEDGRKRRYRIMVKMVAWLPRTQAERERQGRAVVRTDENAFLVLALQNQDGVDGTTWSYNADLAKRWQHKHREAIANLADDRKFENRLTRKRRRSYRSAYIATVARHRRRMDSWLHQSTSAVAGRVDRAGVSELLLDLKPRGAFVAFPWHQWKTRLLSKLPLGVVAKDATADPEPQPEAVEVSEE